MRIGVVGINHKLADLKLREMLAKACQRRFSAGNSTHGEHHFVLLSTCNRTEVYFSSEELAATHTYLLNILRNEVLEDFDQKLYSYFGRDCFLHLARVAAGLDSAIIAETEIQGQVKIAYESATEFLRLPAEMHYLFQKALKIGKKVRSELPLQRGLPDLEHAVLNAGTKIFSPLNNTRILFVGASEINQKILCFMNNKNIQNITLCNRSIESAKNMASAYNLNILDWACISDWHRYDWIIFGTKSPDFLISKDSLPRNFIGHKLIMDLSVPRNVDPKIGRDDRVTLLNIDEINRTLSIRKKRMNHILNTAEEIVMSSAKRHIDLFHHKEKERHAMLAIGA